MTGGLIKQSSSCSKVCCVPASTEFYLVMGVDQPFSYLTRYYFYAVGTVTSHTKALSQVISGLGNPHKLCGPSLLVFLSM